ncbi:MAG TPA: deoxyribonuclease IV [Actinomycetota bacterium]|nr:deoxyribonuclease IV [Actinomycetota bacterium]
MRLGAHVPTRGRITNAVAHAVERGAEALQVFISNPRAWAPPALTAELAAEFRAAAAEADVGPLVAHSSYLINIASPAEGFRRRSVDLARRELEAVAALGGAGLVVHSGAAGAETPRPEAIARAAESVRRIAEDAPAPVILELMAGGAGTVASTLPQAAELFEAVGRDEIRLCLDTCHLFAAGYRLDEPGGVEELFAELRDLGLAERLAVLHANDARDPRGSRRDRHWHIGRGGIGEDGFRGILSRPELEGRPVLIETPGEPEDDRRNLAELRRLAGR